MYLLTNRAGLQLGWSQQMLRFIDEGTVLNYGVKEFDVQGRYVLEILKLLSRYCLFTGSKIVFHQEIFYIMMKATLTASWTSTHLFVPLCDKLNIQRLFLKFWSLKYYLEVIHISIVPLGYFFLTFFENIAQFRLDADFELSFVGFRAAVDTTQWSRILILQVFLSSKPLKTESVELPMTRKKNWDWNHDEYMIWSLN